MKHQFLISEDDDDRVQEQSFRLSLREEEFIGGEYGCRIVFRDKNKDNKNEIKFKKNVEIISYDDDSVVYSIRRLDNFYLNEKVPSDPCDICLYQTCQFIYPLEIKTNYFGKAVAVRNFEEIKSRWNSDFKENLIKRFGKPIAIKYINGVEQVIASEEKFENYILNDWFVYLFFDKLYREYTEKFRKIGNQAYPLLPKVKPVNFDLKSKIEEDDKYIRLHIKGQLSDKRSLLDLSQKLNEPYYESSDDNKIKAEGKLKIQYLFDQISHGMLGFQALFDHNIDGERDINVSMYRLGPIQEIEKKEQDQTENNKSKSIISKFFKW